jgi:hypothetical protein
MSLPLQPQQLQGLQGAFGGNYAPGSPGPASQGRPIVSPPMPSGQGLAPGTSFPVAPGGWAPTGSGGDSTTRLSPEQLGGVAGGGQNPYQAFPGGQNPGAFGTPALFNPLLAQFLLGQRGGLGGMRGPAAGAMPRGPMGSFGTAPGRQPQKQKNPYR